MDLLKDKKVLIVEDEKVNVDLAKIYLDRIGVDLKNIVITDDLLKTIELAEKNIFDIILMDIRIRGARGGVIAAKQIRTNLNGSSPKIIAYSADIFAAKEEEIQKNFDGFIAKPVSLEDFKNAILNALNN